MSKPTLVSRGIPRRGKEDSMAKLTSEIRAMFENQLAIIATASKDGNPNVGPKGSMHVIDDETLAYAEGTGGKTLKNLQENPKIAVVVVDRERADGYQVKGTAELLTSGDFFERTGNRQEERGRPRPKHVARITIEEIYSVRPGMTAKKIG
jgi:predicted pyridoxine 5'-phosphate oxidase superfamily flavin-nucleotide-binding protein